MSPIKELIIFLDGTSRKDIVQELGFIKNNYFAKYEHHKLVWKGNCWMEY